MTYAYLKLVSRKLGIMVLQVVKRYVYAEKSEEASSTRSEIHSSSCEDVGTDIDLKDKILESISKMKQQYFLRQQLYSIMTSPDTRPAYEKLVSSLLEDYLSSIFLSKAKPSILGSLVGSHQEGR